MLTNDKPIGSGEACYFLTLNVVDRIDVFTRPAYKQVVADALNHFVDLGQITIYAWCLMTHHLHLLVRTPEGYSPAWFERDFKKYTTPEILKAIDVEMDLRKDWMVQRFEDFGKTLKRIEKLHLWQNCSSPLHIDSGQPELLISRIDHIHENPVRERIVDLPEAYLYSSARDYIGGKGLVKVKVVQAQGLSKMKLMSAN
ncbi:MAG TPA: transposase [Puia sp.]|nr:transposase [Puia sp.]